MAEHDDIVQQTTPNHKATTLWNLFFHYTAIALAIVQGLILVPLYLKFISSSLYGAWLATGSIAIMLTLIDPGLADLVQQRIAASYGKRDDQQIMSLVFTGLCVTAAFSAIIILAGSVLTPFVPGIVGLEKGPEADALSSAFFMSVISSGVMLYAFMLGAVNLGLQGTLAAGLISTLGSVSGIAATVVLLFMGKGVLAIAMAAVFRAVLYVCGHSCYMIFRFRRDRIAIRLPRERPRGLFHLMSLTFLARTAEITASNLDSLVLARTLSPESVTVFNLTRRPAELARNLALRPFLAIMPSISYLSGEDGRARARGVLLRLLRFTAWLAPLIAGGILVFNRSFLALWVGQSLFAGSAVNTAIGIGAVFFIAKKGLSNLCWALGNVSGNCKVSIAHDILALSFMFVGAKYLGMLGVALAPIASITLVALPYYPRVLSRLLKLTPENRRDIFVELGVSCVWMLLLGIGWSYMLTEIVYWHQLVSLVAAFVISYILGISVFSKTLRDELKLSLRAIKERLCAARVNHC